MLPSRNTNRRTLRLFPLDADSFEPVLHLRFGGRYVRSLDSDTFQHIRTCGFLPDGIIGAAGPYPSCVQNGTTVLPEKS